MHDLRKKRRCLSAYDGTGVTEEGFLKNVRDYIGQYVNLSSIEDYKYSCYTNIKEYGEKGYWTKRENGFYTTSDENKEVYLYLFCFTLYSGGIATSDSVTVTCDKSGNILGLNFEQSGVEWDSVTVNVTKFERSIEAFINNYVSDLNNLTKYYVKNKQLTVYENEIYMKVYVEATFNDGKNEYDVLCPMLVKLDKRIESESVGTEKS